MGEVNFRHILCPECNEPLTFNKSLQIFECKCGWNGWIDTKGNEARTRMINKVDKLSYWLKANPSKDGMGWTTLSIISKTNDFTLSNVSNYISILTTDGIVIRLSKGRYEHHDNILLPNKQIKIRNTGIKDFIDNSKKAIKEVNLMKDKNKIERKVVLDILKEKLGEQSEVTLTPKEILSNYFTKTQEYYSPMELSRFLKSFGVKKEKDMNITQFKINNKSLDKLDKKEKKPSHTMKNRSNLMLKRLKSIMVKQLSDPPKEEIRTSAIDLARLYSDKFEYIDSVTVGRCLNEFKVGKKASKSPKSKSSNRIITRTDVNLPNISMNKPTLKHPKVNHNPKEVRETMIRRNIKKIIDNRGLNYIIGKESIQPIQEYIMKQVQLVGNLSVDLLEQSNEGKHHQRATLSHKHTKKAIKSVSNESKQSTPTPHVNEEPKKTKEVKEDIKTIAIIVRGTDRNITEIAKLLKTNYNGTSAQVNKLSS